MSSGFFLPESYPLDYANFYAIFNAMSNSIILGKSGRLVIPKKIRTALGLHEGSRLDLRVTGGIMEMEPAADDVRIEVQDGFPVVRGAGRREEPIAKAIRSERDARDERVARPNRRRR